MNLLEVNNTDSCEDSEDKDASTATILGDAIANVKDQF